MNKGSKYWLRWLAVLPGALLAGILSTFLLHWVLYLTLTKFIDPYPQFLERLLTPFVIPVVFIWAGSRIAPHHKFKTSVVLFGLWLFLLGSFVFLGLTGANLMGYQLYFQDTGILSIMGFAGALTGLLLSRPRSPMRRVESEKYSQKS